MLLAHPTPHLMPGVVSRQPYLSQRSILTFARLRVRQNRFLNRPSAPYLPMARTPIMVVNFVLWMNIASSKTRKTDWTNFLLKEEKHWIT